MSIKSFVMKINRIKKNDDADKSINEDLVYCSKCGKSIPASNYWHNSSRPNNLQFYCKKHQLEYVQQYYWKNKRKCNIKASLKNKLKNGKISKKQFEKEMIILGNL